MKKNKKIIIIVAAVAVLAASVAAFFIFGKDNSPENVSIAVKKSDFSVADDIIVEMSAQPEKYSGTLSEVYGLSKSKADGFFEAPENWLSFNITVTVKNTGNTDVTVSGFEASNNGKNDMYVCKKTGGELTLSPGAEYPVYANILCENGDLSLEEAKKLANELKINILFSKTPEEFDDGTVSEEKIHSASIQ